MRTMNQVVRHALASHLKRDISELHATQHLERDLGLTPLDILLVTLSIDELDGVALAFEELATVNTVGALVQFFAMAVAWARRRRVMAAA